MVLSDCGRLTGQPEVGTKRIVTSGLPTIRPESGARVPPSFMVGGSGARTFGCWPKGLQCRSKTGSQMLAFEVSDLRGFLFRFIEVPFLSARHNDLFVVAAIRPTTVRLAPSRGRSSGIKRNRKAGQIGQVAAKVLAPDGFDPNSNLVEKRSR